MSFRRVVQLLSQTLLFPQPCILCDGWVSVGDPTPLCQTCFHALEPHGSRICWCCGIPLPAHLALSRTTCAACRVSAPPFDRARSYGGYRGSLRRVIRKFKFEGRQDLAHPLAELMLLCLRQDEIGATPDWILPIPSHGRRRRERGLDHTRLLARSLSRRLKVPVFTGLSRIKATLPQFDLALQERRRNLRGAFLVRNGHQLEGRTVLLVDDIMTTGTTVQEACRTLWDQTLVKQILVLTVARVTLRYDYM